MRWPLFDQKTGAPVGEFEIPDDVIDAARKVERWLMGQPNPGRCRILGIGLVDYKAPYGSDL